MEEVEETVNVERVEEAKEKETQEGLEDGKAKDG